MIPIYMTMYVLLKRYYSQNINICIYIYIYIQRIRDRWDEANEALEENNDIGRKKGMSYMHIH